ncbi:MAG: hemerythrin domain-containing protein [archaeon]
MGKATELLSEEHKYILKVIDSMIKECSLVKSGKSIDKTFFLNAIDFIRNFADKFHHAKEEDILFVELCSDELNLHCNPIEQMLYEHGLGRNFVKGLEQAINSNDAKKVVENALGYSQLLQEHIWKEDNILYPMADQALPEKTQKSIFERFKKVESEKFAKNSIKNYWDFAEECKRR